MNPNCCGSYKVVKTRTRPLALSYEVKTLNVGTLFRAWHGIPCIFPFGLPAEFGSLLAYGRGPDSTEL